MLLGKWTTKNLLLFMFWIAVVIALMNAATTVMNNMPVRNSGSSSVPVSFPSYPPSCPEIDTGA
jgi:hypothetical protein